MGARLNEQTREFNLKIQQLINDGEDPDDITKRLEWDRTPFSLVRSGRRNVPEDKYNLFQTVYKVETQPVRNGENGSEKDGKIIAHLERTIGILEKQVAFLEDHNTKLRDKVEANLDTVLNNQLVHSSLFESFLRSVTSLLVEGGNEEHRDFRVNLHKEAIQRVMGLKKTGNRIEIDSDDIIARV